MTKTEHRLDHTGNPCGAFEMTDIRLQRTEYHHIAGGTRRAVRFSNRVDFDRVTECGAGPMRLHKRHTTCIQLRDTQRRPDHRNLRWRTRRRQAIRRAILIHRRATDDREQRIAISHGVAQSLDDHHAAAFTARHAVGRCIEGATACTG